MQYNIFKRVIDDQIGKVNAKSTDSIAEAISDAYVYSCMNSAKTAFGSIFLPPPANVKKDLKKSILDCLNGVKKCEDIKNTKPSWTLMAVGILSFWTKINFTPGLPPPPCIGPAPGPPSSSGTKVLAGNVNKLSNKLYEIAGKFKENFNEWINLLFDTLVDFHLTLFGNYLGVAIVGLATVPLQVPWVGIFSSANDSSKNPPVEKVKPNGGRGSQLSNIVDFEKKYQYEMVEHSLITRYDGTRIWESTSNDCCSVDIFNPVEEIIKWNFSDLILTHNHPIQIYLESECFTIGGSLSPSDIVYAISYNYYELRAIDFFYKYIVQRPKTGWDKFVNTDKLDTIIFGSIELSGTRKIKDDIYEKIEAQYEKVFDAKYDKIKKDSSLSGKLINELKEKWDDDDIQHILRNSKTVNLEEMVAHTEATHDAAAFVCNMLGAPYQRVLRKKYE